MSKPDTWMPLYIGDYMADTMHLSTEQHGAYLLLLLTAWNRGGHLPNDEAQLALICRADKKAWARMRAVIMSFFTIEGDRVVQARLLSEYEKAVKVNAKQKANGKLGGRPKGTQNKPMGFVSDNPNHNPNETPSPSQVNHYSESSVVPTPTPSPEQPANATREGWLCRKLKAAGIQDAAPHLLRHPDWQALLEKRTDEEIVAVAENKIAANPGKRISLNYLAPALAEEARVSLQGAPPAARGGRQSIINNYAAQAAAARGEGNGQAATGERDITGDCARVA